MYTFRIAVVSLSCLVLCACSSSKPTPTPPPPTVTQMETSNAKGAARAEEVKITATVDKIDLPARLVVLRGADGHTEALRLGPEVRNLDQVKRGDQVVVTYFRSVAFEVVKKDAKLGVTTEGGAARAEVGEQPGALGATVVTVVADIVKLDRANQQAVLKTSDGQTITVDVKNPENFDRVKVGDRVEIQLTEAVAIDVTPAKP